MPSALPIVLLGAVLASSAAAQSDVLSFTSVPNPVTDGSPQAITYRTNDTTTLVTIVLQQGISTNLSSIYNLTTTATGGQFTWTPDTSLPNGDDYALQIIQGDQNNYFGPFRVQGYLGPATTSSTSDSASTTGSNSTTALSYGTISTSTGSPVSRNTTFASASLTASTTSTASDVIATPTADGIASVNAELNPGMVLMAAFGAVLLG